MGALTSLFSLHLSRNTLSGVLPASLSSCNRLNLLDLGENDFDGVIVPYLHGLEILCNSSCFLGCGQISSPEVVLLDCHNW
uniref:Leucine-rich repeat-containing N-terminal plant-type domain-containing protein n=1 Tax=Setaria italica TaxID=4555 RepID=K3Y493_SETIT